MAGAAGSQGGCLPGNKGALSKRATFVGFYEGNYVIGDGGALACLVVEVDEDGGAAGQDVGGGGVAQIVLEGPRFCADAGGASVDVDGGGIEDGFEEVDFGAGYC